MQIGRLMKNKKERKFLKWVLWAATVDARSQAWWRRPTVEEVESENQIFI